MLPTTAIVLIAFAVFAAGFQLSRKTTKLPAGPPGLPFLGNLRDIRGKALHLVLTR